MVILENTKTQLKFRHRCYSLWLGTGGWLIANVFLIMLIYLKYGWLINLLWMPLLLLFSLVASSLMLSVAGLVVICHFDKEYNSLTIKQRGLLKTKVIWHSLADILDVQLESTGWRRHEAADYQITLFFKSGESLSLNLGVKSIADKLETINLIRRFLGMPLEKLR